MYNYTLNLNRKSKRPYLVQEKDIDYKNVSLTDAGLIIDMMNEMYHMADKAEEHVYMLTFNIKMDLTGVFLIGKGTVNACVASIKDIMTRALLAGASRIVLVHNHPSGEPTPSEEDKTMSKKLATACKLFDVELTDSLIIGDNKYYSLRDENPYWVIPAEGSYEITV